MPQRRSSSPVSDDFAELVPFLQKRGIIPSPANPPLIRIAKNIHIHTYSMILWRFRLRKLPKYGQPFIDEIASDALQILPQILMGYGKTASLLTRGIIENTLRHLYFCDHPIEFARMNRDSRWYMTIDALLDYLRNHPFFMQSEQQFDAINRISSLYHDLSAGIHGRTVRDLEMRVALKKIVYDQVAAEDHAKQVRKCAEAANFLIAMFHRAQLTSFQAIDRRIILRTLPTKARQVWKASV
jgi:hypothetical protein